MRVNPASKVEPLIEQIYASALHPALWPETLRAVANHTGSVDCIFQGIDATPSRTNILFSLAGALDQTVWQRHEEVVAEFGDIRADFAVRLTNPGRIYHDRDYIGEVEMRRHPYFQELLSPFGLKYVAFLIGTLERTRVHRLGWGVALQRTPRQGPLAGDALVRFEMLSPHLVRALRIARRFDSGLPMGASTSSGLKRTVCFDLDERGRVIWMNDGAQLYARRGLMQIKQDRSLAFRNAAVQNSVMRSVNAALRRDKSIPLDGLISMDRQEWFFSVAPVPPYARVEEGGIERTPGVSAKLAMDPVRRRSDAGQMGALTPSESRIAWALARGRSLRHAANDVGVTYETARTQLKSAMHKLGVNSQVSLVSRLLSTSVD